MPQWIRNRIGIGKTVASWSDAALSSRWMKDSEVSPMDSIVHEQWVARYMVSPLSFAALPEYIPAMLSAMSFDGVKSPFEADAIASE